MSLYVRPPVVAGQFYPSHPDQLKKELASHLFEVNNKIKAKGIMVPHAGYVYSGGVAGQVYSQIDIPDRLIILSPNHTGLGVPFSINTHGLWETPLGRVKIDEELAKKLSSEFRFLKEDHLAHAREHSLEVQIPFLQYLKKSFTFVPITLSHVSFELCKNLGEAIASVLSKEAGPVLIVASSDMNHYENHKRTLKKDSWALSAMLKMDPEALYTIVHEKDISMCGIIPAVVMLTAAKELKAEKATLIDHKTSGDISGDFDRVVGYAGLIVQ